MRRVRPDAQFIEAIRTRLAAEGNPERARAQQAYLKTDDPMLGVPMPAIRRIARQCTRERPPGTTDELIATAGELWRTAVCREDRYAVCQFIDTAATRRLHAPSMLPLLEEFIVTGAWWDLVDPMTKPVGGLLVRYPDDVRPVVRSWITRPDRWLRRVSIICQLGRANETDLELLTEAIDANSTDADFFIRKGIGWALRQYARTDPDWVRSFVQARGNVLSNLSKREALKHLR